MSNDNASLNVLTAKFDNIIDILSKKDPNQKSDIKEAKASEGTSKKEKDPSELGNETLKEILSIVNLINENQTAANESKSGDKESDGLSGVKGAAQDAAGTSDGPFEAAGKTTAAPANKVDIAEIKQLDINNGLGFAILYWKLDEISKKIGGGDDGAKKKGGGLGKFFTGLLEGASSIGLIAASLIMFAGAMVIFSFVNWMPALVGLTMFALFTTGMLILAKSIGKEQKTFIDFSKGCLLMAAGIGVFALSLSIASAIFSGQSINLLFIQLPPISIMGAITAVGSFLLFVTALAGISHLVSKEQKNFTDFAKGALILSAALGVFAVSLYISSAIVSAQGVVVGGKQILPPFDLMSALIGTGIFLVFLTAIAGISILAGKASGDFKKFAMTSLILTGALVLFSFALYVVGAVVGGQSLFGMPPINLGAALGGVAIFMVFLLAMVGLSILANSFAGNFLLFGITAGILSFSLGLFAISLAMAALTVTGEGGKVGFFEMPKFSGGALTALAALGIMTLFVVAFGALAVAAGALLPFLALGSVGLALLAGTTVLMAHAMASAAAVISGGAIYDENGNPQEMKGLSQPEIQLFFDTFNYFIEGFKSFDFGTLAATMVKAVVLTPTAACIALIADALSKSAEASSKIVEYGGIEEVMKVFMYFSVLVERIGELKFWELAKTVAKAAVLTPTAACIAAIADTLVDAAEASQKVKDVGGIQNVLTLFSKEDGFLRVVDELAQVANTMDAEGAVVFAIVTRSMTPIVDSIGALVGIIDDAARFAPGQPDADKVPLANASIDRLMLGDDGNSGFIAIFNKIADNVQGIGKKQQEAIPMLVPIVDAINGVVDVVIKTGEVDPAVMIKGILSAQAMTNFIESVVETFDGIRKKIKPKKLKPILGFLNGTEDYAGIGIQDMINSLDPIIESLGNMNELKGSFLGTVKNIVRGVETISTLEPEHFEKFNSMTSSINKLSKTHIKKAAEELVIFGTALSTLQVVVQKANPFLEIERSLLVVGGTMKVINDGIESMVSNMKSLKKQAKDMADVANKVNKAASKAAKANAKMAESDPVYAILEKWDKEGVLVKSTAEPPKEKAEKPMQVAFSI